MSRKLCFILAIVFLFLVWRRVFDPERRLILDSQMTATRDQIQNYASALALYKADNGVLPSTEQGLRALIEQPSSAPVPLNWKGPYLKPPVLRKDAWNHDFIYRNPGMRNTATYDIISPGPDGRLGSRDDIGNWR